MHVRALGNIRDRGPSAADPPLQASPASLQNAAWSCLKVRVRVRLRMVIPEG